MIDIGFTGTRKNVTDEQYSKLVWLLTNLEGHHNSHEITVHHGDCVGADKLVHYIATERGYRTHIHPPTNNILRAYCQGDYSEKPTDYITRNQDIVRSSDLLIAIPHSRENHASSQRSGTWKTVRYAKRRKKPYIVILPDGKIEGGNKWKRVVFKKERIK